MPRQSFEYRARIDANWRLRALIATLMVLALAGPSWRDDSRHVVEIWFDDAYSLQTRETESNQTRLTLAVNALIEKLDGYDSVTAKVYSLRNPSLVTLPLDSQTKNHWRKQLVDWLSPQQARLQLPPAARLSAVAENWLITDGTDPELNHWLTETPFHQIIRIGRATENTAVTMLAVRPDLKRPGKWRGIIRLIHYGRSKHHSKIELWSGNDKLKQWIMTLVPGQFRYADFVVDGKNGNLRTLEVRLSPSDALTQDDQISLPLPLPITTKIHGTCPPPLLAAIKAHPFLRSSAESTLPIGLNIVCGDTAIDDAGASLRFHQSTSVQRITATPLWTEFADKLNELVLTPQLIRETQPNDKARQRLPILIADGTPLITLTESEPREVDCFIDMSHKNFAQSQEYPILFAGLVELAVNRPLLSPMATIMREPEASRIEPYEMPSVQAKPALASRQPSTVDFVPYLLLLAISLLILASVLKKSRLKPSPDQL